MYWMLQAPGILDGEGDLVISTKVLNLIYPDKLGVVKPQRLFYNADKTPKRRSDINIQEVPDRLVID